MSKEKKDWFYYLEFDVTDAISEMYSGDNMQQEIDNQIEKIRQLKKDIKSLVKHIDFQKRYPEIFKRFKLLLEKK